MHYTSMSPVLADEYIFQKKKMTGLALWMNKIEEAITHYRNYGSPFSLPPIPVSPPSPTPRPNPPRYPSTVRSSDADAEQRTSSPAAPAGYACCLFRFFALIGLDLSHFCRCFKLSSMNSCICGESSIFLSGSSFARHKTKSANVAINRGFALSSRAARRSVAPHGRTSSSHLS